MNIALEGIETRAPRAAKVELVSRVRRMWDRSRRSLLDGSARQRLEGSTRNLVDRSRESVAQFVGAAAPAETGSQDALAGVCSSIALRDLNLVDALLEQLEHMEVDEDDPEALERLYAVDHLATRLRRNSENLRVLAGREAGGGSDAPLPLLDVVRAGMSAIPGYHRVRLGTLAQLHVVGFAADDMSRVLAELLDNATAHSPPSSEVAVGAHLTERGSVLVRVEDSGIGLPPDRLSELNERLAGSPRLDRGTVQHMGLAVVRRLALAHGVRVWLARRSPHGTTASVLIPAVLVRDSVRSHRESEPPNPSVRGGKAAKPQASQRILPQRADQSASSRSASAEPDQQPEDTEGETTVTANGLPRRVPRSLKDPHSSARPEQREAVRLEQADRESHQRLLADLGAFADGEQQAHADQHAHDKGRDQ